MSPSPLRAVAFLVLATAGCVGTSGSEPTRVEYGTLSRRGELEFAAASSNFIIHSEDQSQPTMDALVRTAEAAIAEYRRLVPDAPPQREPIKVRIYKTPASAKPYLDAILEPGDPEFMITRGGFTVPHFGVVVINPAVDAARSNLAHEGFHAFAQATFVRRIPPFVEEGVASSFEGVQLIDERTIVFNPKRHPRREEQLYKAVREDAWIPLDRVLDANAAEFMRDRPGEVDLFYAHAWAFALYLDTVDCAGRSGTSALRAMLADAATGKPLPDGVNSRDAWAVVVHYAGEPWEQVEAGFRRFVTQVIAPRGAPAN